MTTVVYDWIRGSPDFCLVGPLGDQVHLCLSDIGLVFRIKMLLPKPLTCLQFVCLHVEKRSKDPKLL